MSVRARAAVFFDNIGELFVFSVIVLALAIAERRNQPVRIARVVARPPRRSVRAMLGDVAFWLGWTARHSREKVRIGLYRVGWFARHLRGRARALLYHALWLFWHVRDAGRVRCAAIAHRVLWLFWHVRDGVRARLAARRQRPELSVQDRRDRLPYGHF